MAVSKNGKTKTTKRTTAKAKTAAPKNRVKQHIPEPVGKRVEIAPLRIGMAKVQLTGTSPLVTNPFGEKARRELLEAQTGHKSTTKSRDPRSPEEEYLESFYVVEGELPSYEKIDDNNIKQYDEKKIKKALKTCTFGIPLTAFKNALISAARNTPFNMTQIKQALFVSGEHHEYAIIKGTPHLDNRIVRVGNKLPMERFRPMWDNWSTSITVEYDKNVFGRIEDVTNLVQTAGFYVGVCEGRPERSSLGWGRWTCADNG